MVGILLGILAGLAFLVLLIAYICFYLAFYVSEKKKKQKKALTLPDSEIYTPYRDVMETWLKEAQALPHEEVSIRSFDGLTLCGKYYEHRPGAPLELLFHGYRSTVERDLSGGIERCFRLGRNVLLVSQRGSGNSDGNVITFGINERKDCLSWVHFAIERFGADTEIILGGISMGAATVTMASAMPLPENVLGVVADCGYSSPKEIIQDTIRKIGLPVKIFYPFVKLGAKIYGRFDLEETTPEEAVKHSRVPILFIHGESDDFVPCEMSRRNYAACTSLKKLYTVPKAGHGLCYPVDRDKYIQTLQEAEAEWRERKAQKRDTLGA